MNELGNAVFGPGVDYEARLTSEIEIQRARREAKRLLDSEDRGSALPVEALTLREHLSKAPPETHYRIDGLQTIGSRVLLVAQGKTGKTTLRDNLVRSLVDGDPFLGIATTRPPIGTVVVIDLEMSSSQTAAWFKPQGIRRDDAVVIIPLRGNVAAFDLFTPATFKLWVARLKRFDCAYLVIDPIKPIFDTFGLDENNEAGRFLVQVDALLTQAGIPDACLIHHMGWTGERARGSSRLLDWPDATWTLTKADAAGSPRFLSAYGRDVDQREQQLHFDPVTRHLSVAGGSRRDLAAMAALDEVIAVLQSGPLSGRAVQHALRESDYTREQVKHALRLGAQKGLITTSSGPKRSTLHELSAPVNRSEPSVFQRTSQLSAPVIPTFIRSGHSHTDADVDQPEAML